MVTAYVLINTSPGRAMDVAKRLQGTKGVSNGNLFSKRRLGKSQSPKVFGREMPDSTFALIRSHNSGRNEGSKHV